ncbi:SDR family NAD(P)-dependent oxidoreductase, partial [Patescibacteria group bacterium]|nr:SDR family NAD(P)-dependent oxidoreductase [Patescibacteria group bacterium]
MFFNKQTFCDLSKRVAIVTGAKQGMGRTHALALAKAGAKVVVSDINEQECQKVVEEIKKLGKRAIAVKCDVSNKQEVDALIQKTIQAFGKVDILVNNAGICPFKPFLEMSEEEFEKVIDVNLKGYFLCAQAATREMAKQKKGAIVNIASIAMGQVGSGFAGLTHYCASKG